jgi:small-conductance mechanosensitive channel
MLPQLSAGANGTRRRREKRFFNRGISDWNLHDQLRADPEQAPNLLGDLEWFGLDQFGDSAVVLRARIKTVPGKKWAVGRAYNAILKRIFDERRIEIPFPHTTLLFGENKKGETQSLRVESDNNSYAGNT